MRNEEIRLSTEQSLEMYKSLNDKHLRELNEGRTEDSKATFLLVQTLFNALTSETPNASEQQPQASNQL